MKCVRISETGSVNIDQSRSQLLYDYKFVSVSTFSGCDFLSLAVFVRSHTHWPQKILWPSSNTTVRTHFFLFSLSLRWNQNECCIFSDIIVELATLKVVSVSRDRILVADRMKCVFATEKMDKAKGNGFRIAHARIILMKEFRAKHAFRIATQSHAQLSGKMIFLRIVNSKRNSINLFREKERERERLRERAANLRHCQYSISVEATHACLCIYGKSDDINY